MSAREFVAIDHTEAEKIVAAQRGVPYIDKTLAFPARIHLLLAPLS